MMKEHKKGSSIAFGLSIATTILAAVVFIAGLDQVLGLAGTQWILISILLAVYANYLGACCQDASCCSSKEKDNSAE